jgi:hypothetical protein
VSLGLINERGVREDQVTRAYITCVWVVCMYFMCVVVVIVGLTLRECVKIRSLVHVLHSCVCVCVFLDVHVALV